jgi:MOSC domain-containing protein YiiM
LDAIGDNDGVVQTCITGSILSVNVGQPRLVPLGNNTVATAIFKYPVETAVAVRGHNLEGDRQADLRVHGGPYKAVYLYPSEHYQFWKEQLGVPDLPFGAFGENLTTAGFTEEDVYVGDQFRAGTATLQVTQPRMPCYKLNLRFDRSDMVKRFWLSVRPGIYFSIVKEGELAKSDAIEKIADGAERVSVADVVRLVLGKEWSNDLRTRALRAPLHGSWKRDIESRLIEEG